MLKTLATLAVLVAVTACAATEPSQPTYKKGDQTVQAKKVLIVLTSHDRLGDTGKKTGYYLPEASHPHHVFTQAGYDVDFVSPKGGTPPMDGADLSDPLNRAFVENPAVMSKVEQSMRPTDVDPTAYAAIFYAGGHGTMWDFADNAELASLAAKIYDRGGVVSAVCHGPAGLVNVKLANGKYLVDGKTVSTFTNEEEAAVKKTEIVPFLLESKLIERGATVTKAPNFQEHVAVSDRLVTGQNPASASGVARKVVEVLNR